MFMCCLYSENSQLLDHQKSRLADISDSQLEMRTLLKEMIHKIDKVLYNSFSSSIMCSFENVL